MPRRNSWGGWLVNKSSRVSSADGCSASCTTGPLGLGGCGSAAVTPDASRDRSPGVPPASGAPAAGHGIGPGCSVRIGIRALAVTVQSCGSPTFTHSAAGMAPFVSFSIATASVRPGRREPRQSMSRWVRLIASSSAAPSRVIPEASIQRDSFVSPLRGRPGKRFDAAAMRRMFDVCSPDVKQQLLADVVQARNRKVLLTLAV
jgi:hypothetical protein